MNPEIPPTNHLEILLEIYQHPPEKNQSFNFCSVNALINFAETSKAAEINSLWKISKIEFMFQVVNSHQFLIFLNILKKSNKCIWDESWIWLKIKFSKKLLFLCQRILLRLLLLDQWQFTCCLLKCSRLLWTNTIIGRDDNTGCCA